MSDTSGTSDSGTSDISYTPEERAYIDSGGGTAAPDRPSPAPAEVQATPPAPPSPEPGEGGDEVETQTLEKAERVVPLATLLEARTENKAMRDRMHQIELDNARYLERFKIIEQAHQQQQPQEKPPSPRDDPFAYVETVPGQLQQLAQKVQTFEQREKAAEARTQVLSAYKQDADTFKASHSDFDQAYEFLVSGRIAELQAVGHQNPQEGVHQDELAIVIHALQTGKSPAETMYNVAKARGWRPGNGSADASGKLDAIERGQQQGRSLQSVGGAGGADDMTAERLLKMPLNEYEKWVNKNPAKARRIMGG